MNAQRLAELAARWRRNIVFRDVLLIGGATVAATGIATLWLPLSRLLLIAAVLLFAAAFLYRWLGPRPQLNPAIIAQHLDRTYPELEESSALWLRAPDALTPIEQLQKKRLDAAVQRLSTRDSARFAAPHATALRRAVLCAMAGLLVFALTLRWSVSRQRAPLSSDAGRAQPQTSHAAQPSATAPPKIIRAELLVKPPAYTGRAERRVDGLNAEIEEGSAVTWMIALDQTVQQARLTADVALEPAGEDGALRGTREISETMLYQLEATLPDGSTWRPPEIHSLKVTKDRAPSLKIAQPVGPRTEVAPAAEVHVAVEVLANDDYAITDAHLIATVAKGTGEAVKFREQQIAFDVDEAGENGSRRFSKTLDLIALGLARGDELYFHVEAADNRQPTSNRARSETRFIVLKGAEQTASTPAAGIAGVNLVPEYFRSQRQIIIDTEKLIADRATLPAPEFQQRANSLGIDQQLLRQRYGQFLGEEAESDGDEEAHFPGDGHDHGEAVPQTHSEVAERFGHTHDSQDQATLFDRQTKGTMRQALASMWQAERFLRMAQPEEALAPENRALEILKELQQADRSYVQRVGFEAAPLDVAGRRLRGEVDEVPLRATSAVAAPAPNEEMEAVRALLRLPMPDVETLARAEPALIQAATAEPERFLAALEELRRLHAGGARSAEGDSTLKAALLQLLPAARPAPQRQQEVSPALAAPYLERITAEAER
jgi:hypothetical protein